MKRQLRVLLGGAFAVLAMVITMVLALVLAVLPALPFLLLPRGRRERYTAWLTAAAAWAATHLALLTRVRRSGERVLPAGGALYVCNHRSWLDPVLLAAYTRSGGLSKAEVRFLPIIGLGAWLGGTVFVKRGSQADRRRARDEVLAMLRAGRRIHLFPEGTRSRDGTIAARASLRLLEDCHQAGIPVVPCAVWGTERVLPAGKLVAWPGQEVRLALAAPLNPDSFSDAKSYAAAGWAAVVKQAETLATDAQKTP